MRKHAVLFTMMTASFMTAFMGSSLNVALPSMSAEFGMNAVMTGWIASSFLLSTAVFMLPSGRLSDLHGRKKLFVLGVLINMTASLLIIFPAGEWMLISLRAIQGIGSAMMFATSTPIVITSYPAAQRGKVLGITVGAVYAGLSAGPFFGGMLTHYFGWRAIFILCSVLLALIAVLALRHVERDHPVAHGEPFDAVGSVLNGLFLSLLIFGMARVPHREAWFLFAGGALSGALFVLHQLNARHPVLRLALFRGNPVFLKSNLAAMINYSATFAIAFLMSIYFQIVKGFSPQGAGVLLLAQPAAQALLSPAMGRLSDRVEPGVLASLGMGLITSVLVGFAFAGASVHVGVIVAGLVLLGVGFALFSSPNTNAVMSSVGHRDLSMASAILSTMRVAGQILSMGIAMLVFSLIIGRVKIDVSSAANFVDAMRICFVIFAALCAAGVYFSMSRGKLRPGRDILPVVPPAD